MAVSLNCIARRRVLSLARFVACRQDTGRRHPRGLVLSLALVASSCIGDGEQTLAFENVTVVDGTGGQPLLNQTVLVRGDSILAVGRVESIPIPRNAVRIDGRGRTLIPGLIDLHVHLSKVRASALPLFLSHGVTAVRDLGGDWGELRRWRDEVAAGTRTGPRIWTAGSYLEAPANVERMLAARTRGEMVEPVERTRIAVDSPERARAVVDSLAALGVDLIKLRTVVSLATYQAIIDVATRHGLAVAGHTEGIPLPSVIEAGQTSIAHFLFPFFDDLSEDERREMWRDARDAGVSFVPTLTTWQNSTFATHVELVEMMADSMGTTWPDRPLMSRYTQLDWAEQLLEHTDGDSPDSAAFDWRGLYESTIRNLREMHQEGVKILAGSDVAVINIFPGIGLHDELELLVREVGMTPIEAIEAATAGAAALLGTETEVGTIAQGMRADLVLVSGDVATDITRTRAIELVVFGGVVYDASGLEELREGVRSAAELTENDWR